MDGATKYVKGDAAAGIIITLINLVGGTIMGVMFQGLMQMRPYRSLACSQSETDLFHRYRLYLYLFQPVFLSQKAPMRMIFQESF